MPSFFFGGEKIKMYHGTTKENAQKIKSKGFMPSLDGMLGKGVYLSRDINKAKLHGDGTIIVSEVSVGKVKRIDKQGHSMRKAWGSSGYDSAWVPPNCGMVRRGLEENCIRDPRRVKIIQVSLASSTEATAAAQGASNAAARARAASKSTSPSAECLIL
eukprot:CAMPEP_0170613284 /NCGR_PEP_ID=MMETSP0224-20130122/24190_1 /TAXON_ID=285029 /ORGANISM="Togula jolla, Strain CCCM 725" /LENGTH=158 /DNA_ID=CAMNT_0010938875 /DNA_START=42 /DNA_END=518 /DNA_ORIENTATION=-